MPPHISAHASRTTAMPRSWLQCLPHPHSFRFTIEMLCPVQTCCHTLTTCFDSRPPKRIIRGGHGSTSRARAFHVMPARSLWSSAMPRNRPCVPGCG